MKVIRGSKIEQWLEEDSSYNDLEGGVKRGFPNTRFRHNATGPVTINRVEYIPYVDHGMLRVQGQAGEYEPTVSFSGVTFEPADAPTNTTFRASDNQEYHVQSIPLNSSNVRVRCTCLDFYYRFAALNAGDNSLEGKPPPPYKTTGNRPPANPAQVPGVCKHIIKLVQRLKQGRIVT